MRKTCLVMLLSTALAAPAAVAGGWGSRHHYGYGGHYGGHFGGHYRHHGGGDAGAALLAGLVIGGLAGWFISEDRRYYQRRAYWDDPYPRHHYNPPRYREYSYTRPRPYRETVRVVRPTEIVTRAARVDPEFADRNCRMTREYTTTVEIDGERHSAYGTRCLTADGTWVLGRPMLEPELE